jgi:hypothetical protein
MIRSHNCLKHHEFQGQVPETLFSGQNADISPIVENGCYDWIKFYAQIAKFTEPKEVYGRWLRPDPDMGPEMASKILKSNGHVIVLSTYRGLSDDELMNPDEVKIRDQLSQAMEQKLGGSMIGSNIYQVDPEAETPYHDRYGDEIEGTYSPTIDIDDAPPECQDTYIEANLSIPLEGKATTGKVKK